MTPPRGGEPGPQPAQLGEIAARVEARLAKLLAGEAARWASVDPDLVAPIDLLSGLVLSGGKRVRPAFCHWAYVGAGGADLTVSTEVGAAVELLHAFALVHDDVMDGSDRRRGRPTVHRAFADRHETAGWRGESRRFGEGVAILVGDLAFVYADALLGAAGPDARRVWDELRIEVNIGQYLDVLGTARGRADLAMAHRIAVYKTAKYTIERPLHLGAALAGRFGELAEPLSDYGLPLGEAYQLRDDVLGAFGDAEATGKPVGDDLREGKPTLLLALAAQRADHRQAAELDGVGDPDLDDDDVVRLQAVLRDTGAVAEVEARIGQLVEQASRAAEDLAVTTEARAALVTLAHHVAWRDR